MTTHNIPTIDNSTGEGHFKSDAVLLIAGSSDAGGPGGWSVGGWTAAGEGRVEFNGPMVPGPYAYAFGLGAYIDNRGGTGAEHRRLEAAGLLFRCEAGDTVVLDGTAYTLTLDRRGYPALTKEA